MTTGGVNVPKGVNEISLYLKKVKKLFFPILFAKYLSQASPFEKQKSKQTNIDFNILGKKKRGKFHFIGTLRTFLLIVSAHP